MNSLPSEKRLHSNNKMMNNLMPQISKFRWLAFIKRVDFSKAKAFPSL
jgi:hypothetical protein